VANDLNDIRRRIASVADRIKQREPDLLLLAGKRLEGLMKKRIFNNGKATDESLIGKYKSKSWIKKRSLSGRQVNKVDLQDEGNLIRNFRTVRDG